MGVKPALVDLFSTGQLRKFTESILPSTAAKLTG
jgi:hypothetical protein